MRCASERGPRDGRTATAWAREPAGRREPLGPPAQGTQLVVVAHGRCALIAINTLGSKTKPAPDVGVDAAKAVAGRL